MGLFMRAVAKFAHFFDRAGSKPTTFAHSITSFSICTFLRLSRSVRPHLFDRVVANGMRPSDLSRAKFTAYDTGDGGGSFGAVWHFPIVFLDCVRFYFLLVLVAIV